MSAEPKVVQLPPRLDADTFADAAASLPALAELAKRTRWVLWQPQFRNGKLTKVPFQPAGLKASSTDPTTWSSLEDCLAKLREGLGHGVGYVFAEVDPYAGVDLDKCRNSASGELEPWAAEAVTDLASYAEASPTGTGVHVIVKARLPEAGGRKGRVEVYQAGRYFCFTGAHLPDTPDEIVEAQEAAERLWWRYCRPDGPKAPERSGTGPTGGGDGEGWCSVVIEPAEFPWDRFQALLDNDPLFKKTWERQRTDDGLSDQSMSSYDMALAVRAVQANWSNGEIAALLRAFHKAQGERLEKAGGNDERPDYLQRTIWQARQWVEERQAERAAAKAAEEDGRDYSQDGLALSLGDLWRDDARHVAIWNRWLFWDGTRWKIEEKLAHMTKARRFVQQQAREMVARVGAEQGALNKARGSAKVMRSAATIAAVVSLARSNEWLDVGHDIWDQDPRLLGTPGGVVDLRTGHLAAAQRETFITKRTSVAPALPGTPRPRWDAFLARIFRHDLELVPYLQRLLGYAATGLTVEQKLFIAHGEGQNGKRVLFNTAYGVLGEYAEAAPGDLLLATTAMRHPTELARLRGARLVLMSEVPDNAMWNEPLLKRLTGEDPITARFMHQDFFTYMPAFTPVLQVNELPRFNNPDLALRRRMELIPFSQTIPDEEKDEHLFEKLRPEWPAILRWVLDGAEAYLARGLRPPKSVQVATEAYLAKFDLLSGWLDDCCECGPTAPWTDVTTLHSHFASWCAQRGHRPMSRRAMSMLLAKKGFERKSTSERNGFHIGVGAPEAD